MTFVTFTMSSDINVVTSMMSSDIVVTFITTRCAMTFVFDIPAELVSPGMLQYAVGCRACLFVCSDLLAVSEFVFSLLLFLDFRENGNRCAVTQIE